MLSLRHGYVDHVISFLIITTLLVPSTLGLMFNMGEIGPENQKDIITDGVGTYISTDGIQLTTQKHTRAGRATYVKLLHLWDAASGQLADFTTYFSVSIDYRNTSDRLSFFLAHNDSLVNASGGMHGHPMHGTSTQLVPFVAVEFDTHSNSNWDPDDGRDHVGINVNSSVEFEKWGSNVSYGNQYFVKIHFDSGSHNLSVFYGGTFEVNQFELRYPVDLRNVLPEYVVFGFSSSSSSGGQFHRNSVKSWFFNSTVLHMDKRRLKKKEKKKRVYIVISPLAFLLLMLVIGGFFTFICLRKKARANDQTIAQNPDGGRINSWEPRIFTLEELSLATDDFNPNRILGKGGFAFVYKATLTTGETVAVKRIQAGTSQDGMRQYEAEVKILGGGTRHRHLARVVGWCNEDAELLVVYEFMANKSLDNHLFNSSMESLRWDVRYNIAKELAKALRYLHTESGNHCILHRDIKAGNVLLDSNFEAKLGDFGLAKLLDPDRSLEMRSVLAGTPGYIDPELFQGGRFSQRSDVYSYGMVVLEIVTGRRCTGFINPNQQDQTGLAEWVRNKYTNGKIREIVDPRLKVNYGELQLKGLVALGLWCATPDSSARPTDMGVVAYILEGRSEQSFSLIPNFEGTPSYLQRAWMVVSPIFAQIFTRQPNPPLTVGVEVAHLYSSSVIDM